MHAPVGFFLLSHDRLPNAYRLIHALNFLFNFPPIVVHHDYSKGEFFEAPTGNVHPIHPSLPTAWARWSIMEATLKGFEVFHQPWFNPDWVLTLSGTDYPLSTVDEVLDDLELHPYDAHMQYEVVNPGHYRYPRYMGHQASPFTPSRRLYSGLHWMALNRRARELVLTAWHEDPELVAFFKAREFPEEAFVQTVLCNSPQVNVHNRDHRFMLWEGLHPVTLTEDHWTRLEATEDHFARKFDLDDPGSRAVLAKIDDVLNIPPQEGTH